MIGVVGGFTIDTYLLFQKQLEQQWADMGFVMVAPTYERIVEDRSGRRRVVEGFWLRGAARGAPQTFGEAALLPLHGRAAARPSRREGGQLRFLRSAPVRSGRGS